MPPPRVTHRTVLLLGVLWRRPFGLEHLQHAVGDDESADDVERAEHDGKEDDHRVERPIGAQGNAGYQHRGHQDDAVDGVRARHEWRVEHGGHLADHFGADEDRQYKDRDDQQQRIDVAHAATPCGAASTTFAVAAWTMRPSLVMQVPATI